MSLDKHGVWLELFDEFLCSLGEHGGLIHRSNHIDILPIEALGQVDQGSVKAVLSTQLESRVHLPVSNSVVDGGVEVGCTDEDVAGED
jgi:hypothetical protein